MNARRISTLLMATMIGATFGSTVVAQDDMNMEGMMEAYSDASQTGPMHELMLSGTGKWHARGESFMPGSDAMPWEGTIVSKAILDGHYVIEKWDIPDMMGMSFSGMALIGFNNATEEFETTWVDSMSTGIYMSTGTYDESTHTMNMSGEMLDPVRGPTKMRSAITYTSDNEYEFEMYDIAADGTESLMMRATVTRGDGEGHEMSHDGKGKSKSEGHEHE